MQLLSGPLPVNKSNSYLLTLGGANSGLQTLFEDLDELAFDLPPVGEIPSENV